MGFSGSVNGTTKNPGFLDFGFCQCKWAFSVTLVCTREFLKVVKVLKQTQRQPGYNLNYLRQGDFTLFSFDLFASCVHLFCLQVMKQATLMVGCFYQFAGFRITGTVCRTNKPSNTALRGFGAPQGLSIMEHIISEVGIQCQVPGRKVWNE